MRVRLLILLVLGTGLVNGCASGGPLPKATTSWLARMRPMQGPTGPDVIQIDIALIERPLGDSYLNKDLWDQVNEQKIDLERKMLLLENGLRIGQIDGITPAGLQALLTSERSCANPRQMLRRSGSAPPPLVLGPTLAVSRFQLHPQIGQTVDVELEQAQCRLAVLPTLTNDGRTRLQFTPQILHGESTLTPRPNADRSGWELQAQQPTENYAALSFEVTLAPNEFLVIGAGSDRPETLGYQCFVRPDESAPVQRLLVIRTGRMAQNESVTNSEDASPFPSAAPPLAIQAALTSGRPSSR